VFSGREGSEGLCFLEEKAGFQSIRMQTHTHHKTHTLKTHPQNTHHQNNLPYQQKTLFFYKTTHDTVLFHMHHGENEHKNENIFFSHIYAKCIETQNPFFAQHNGFQMYWY
jgi:hypothetical protein